MRRRARGAEARRGLRRRQSTIIIPSFAPPTPQTGLAWTTAINAAGALTGESAIGAIKTGMRVVQQPYRSTAPPDPSLAKNPDGSRKYAQVTRMAGVARASLPGQGQAWFPPLPSSIDASLSGLPGDGIHNSLLPYSQTSPGAGTPKDGDVNAELEATEGGTSRCEWYGRAPATFSSEASQYPDPPGSVRWYMGSLYVPSTVDFSETGKWGPIFGQHKGQNSGSPPVEQSIAAGATPKLQFSGIINGVARTHTLGTVPRDTWIRLIWGIKWDPDPAIGWIEIWWAKGSDPAMVNVIPKTFRPTMAAGDKIYRKALGGIYRTTIWATATHEVYAGDEYIAFDRATLLGS